MRIIAISGVISRYQREESSNTSPATLKKSLEAANGEDALITINSPGGNLTEGLEMYSMIRNYRGNTETRVVSVAASMASIIALAGKVRTAESTAMYMIHNAAGVSIGDYREMQRMSDLLKNASHHLSNIYTERTGQDNEKIRDLMNRETWFFGAALSELGFKIVDAAAPVQESTAKFEANARYQEYLRNLKSEEIVDDLERVAAMLTAEIPGKPKQKPEVKNEIKSDEQNIINSNSANAGEETQEELVKNLDELKAQYPDLYAQAVAVGVTNGIAEERDRVKAHLTMGEAGNCVDLAVKNIKEGTGLTNSVNAEYMAAGMTARDKQNLVDDNTGEIIPPVDEIKDKAETDEWTAKLKSGMGVKNG